MLTTSPKLDWFHKSTQSLSDRKILSLRVRLMYFITKNDRPFWKIGMGQSQDLFYMKYDIDQSQTILHNRMYRNDFRFGNICQTPSCFLDQTFYNIVKYGATKLNYFKTF